MIKINDGDKMGFQEIEDKVLEVFEVKSTNELLEKYGRYDFYDKIDAGLLSYDDFIYLGYLDLDEVVERIGIEKALNDGIISKSEAIEFEQEMNEMKK